MSTTLRQAAFHRYPILVISGGSSGIGRGLLEAYFNARVDGLAINLSRSCPDELLQEPRLTHLPCDLSDASGRATTFEQLVQLIHERSPEGELLLVNNSGMGDFGSFPKLARERLLQTIDLNVSGTIDLSMRLLPLLRERGGTLMTIASTSAFQPTPMMATYGATKAFLVHWSLALNEELRGSKVSALAVCPGPTYTDFLSKAGFEDLPEVPWGLQHVNAVLDTACRGLVKGKALVTSGCWNRIVASVSSLAPFWLASRVAAKLMQNSKSDQLSR